MRVNLARLRESRGYSQQSFAERVGCSRSHYSQIETGDKNAHYSLMKKIRKVLDCEYMDLDKLFFNQKSPYCVATASI
jgi:transcriptional regulator with XRE-family HTH domain